MRSDRAIWSSSSKWNILSLLLMWGEVLAKGTPTRKSMVLWGVYMSTTRTSKTYLRISFWVYTYMPDVEVVTWCSKPRWWTAPLGITPKFARGRWKCHESSMWGSHEQSTCRVLWVVRLLTNDRVSCVSRSLFVWCKLTRVAWPSYLKQTY